MSSSSSTCFYLQTDREDHRKNLLKPVDRRPQRSVKCCLSCLVPRLTVLLPPSASFCNHLHDSHLPLCQAAWSLVVIHINIGVIKKAWWNRLDISEVRFRFSVMCLDWTPVLCGAGRFSTVPNMCMSQPDWSSGTIREDLLKTKDEDFPVTRLSIASHTRT